MNVLLYRSEPVPAIYVLSKNKKNVNVLEQKYHILSFENCGGFTGGKVVVYCIG